MEAALLEAAMKKLKLRLIPHYEEVPANEVLLKLSSLNLPIEHKQEEIESFLIFKKEADLDTTLTYILNNDQELRFSAQRLTPPSPKKEDKKSMTVHEHYSNDVVKNFLAQYLQTHSTEPTILISEPVALKPRRFKMHSNSKLLQSKVLSVKKCTICFKPTTYQCSRTDAFTCSLECQEKRLGIVAKERLPGLVGRQFLLVNYTSAKTLFVLEKKNQDAFIQMANKIAVLAKESPHVKASVAVGQNVLAFHQDMWYRGTVTAEVKKRKLCRVSLPDLGVEKVFAMKQLKVPTAEVDAEVFTVKCSLADVIGHGISFEAEKILEQLIAEGTPLISYSPTFDEMIFRVDHVGGANLAEMLNKALVVTVTNDGPSYYLKDLPVHPVSCEENLQLIATDLSDCDLGVSVAQGEYLDKCHRFETQFQECADKSEGFYTPCNKEICLIRMMNQEGTERRWLRAFGLVNMGDRFPRFELLDYGLLVKVNIKDVRKIPKELLYPAATWTVVYKEELGHNDKLICEVLKQRPFKLYPIVIPKIERFSVEDESSPEDHVVGPDFLRQIYEIKVVS